jgi:glucosyltransferase
MASISVVVPSYNEQEAVGHLYEELTTVAAGMSEVSFEFIFVDDGSNDGTLDAVRALRDRDPRVRFVSFSRNFGKEAALFAGLKHATGDYVVLIDADLQDPPELIPEMYRAVVEDGYDCAAARRTSRRGESPIRSLFAEAFYRVFNMISKTPLVSGARDFRLMSRQMVDAILELSEVNRFSKGLLTWVGFNTTWIEYSHVDRFAGTTKWSFFGLVRYSIEGIVDFSTAPLALASALGFLFCIVAFVWVIVIVVRTEVMGNEVAGWSSLACIVLFASGLQFFTIGIMGQYIARTYLETKRRPVYVVRETES